MPSLEQVLAGIPGIAGYEASRQQTDARNLDMLKMAGAGQSILAGIAAQQEKAQAVERAKSVRARIAAGADPRSVALEFGDIKDILTSETSRLNNEATTTAARDNRAATIEAARINAEAQRAQRTFEITQAGEREIARIREQAAQNRITREEADAREARMREQMIRLTASLREPRPEQPLVPIVGDDGKPVLVRREEAHGKTPWAVGSALDAKNTGRNQLKDTVDRLAASYDNLEKQGAVVSPTKNVASNIWERASASGPGQFIAGAVGTQAQRERDSIASARASLMAALKAATGLSAQQLNSNAELQFYMQMATDPTKSIEANRDALAYFDKTYNLGLGLSGDPARIAPARQSTVGPIRPAYAGPERRSGNTVKFGDLK